MDHVGFVAVVVLLIRRHHTGSLIVGSSAVCWLPLPTSLPPCIAWRLFEPARCLTLWPLSGALCEGGGVFNFRHLFNDLLIRSSKCITSYCWPLFRVGLMNKSWSITFLVYQDDNH